MEIKTNKNFCILTPLSSKIDGRQTLRLAEEIKANPFFKIGLDLSFVEDCTIEFINFLSQLKNVSVFNINSDIFSLFNLMKIDKKVNLYVSESDFEDNNHRLLNREFKIV